MTDPSGEILPNSQTAGTVAPFYQNADPQSLARLKNLDLHASLEAVRDQLFNGLLGGFENATEAVQAGVEAIILALTGQFGSLEDLQEWAETRDIGFFFELLTGVQDSNADDAASYLRGWFEDFQTLINLGVQGATGAESTPIGKLATDFRDALRALFGVADGASEAAAGANAQLGELIAIGNADGAGGIYKSLGFAYGNGPLNPTDWTTFLGDSPNNTNLIVRDQMAQPIQSPFVGIQFFEPYAVLNTAFTQDDQAVSVVVRSPTTPGHAMKVILRANDAFTEGVCCSIAGDGTVEIMRFTRSGGTFTTSPPLATADTNIKTASLIEFRCSSNLYEVKANNSLVCQYLDAGNVIPKGPTRRRCGFTQPVTRGLVANVIPWFVSRFTMSDYLGGGYRGMGFDLYRGTTDEAGSLSGSSGGQWLASNTFDVQRASANITIINAGAGIVKIPRTGWWNITVSALASNALTGSSRWAPALFYGPGTAPTTVIARGQTAIGTGNAEDQHLSGAFLVYLEKDHYIEPGLVRTGGTGGFTPKGGYENATAFKGAFING